MALKKFFNQNYIEKIDAANVEEDFIQYFQKLSEERKEEIIETRPDLKKILGYEEKTADSMVSEETEEAKEKVPAEIEPELIYSDKENHFEKTEDAFEKNRTIKKQVDIAHSIYQNMPLKYMLSKGTESEVSPVEMLSIRKEQKKCLLHHIPFRRFRLVYDIGHTYSMYVYYCDKCKRMYVWEDRIEQNAEAIRKKGIPVKIYDLETTESYLIGQIKAVRFDEDKLYVADLQSEDNYVCPLHHKTLEQMLYYKEYKNRRAEFTGYICEDCKKVLISKKKMIELQDSCAEKGIPEIPAVSLVETKNIQKKFKTAPAKADYYIKNGKRKEASFTAENFYELGEQNTVVVSDSKYCILQDHETEDANILFWVNEKRNGRKRYFCEVGYCGECDKFYMDRDDYDRIIRCGRAELNILMDFPEEDYLITSGDIFNLEREYLQDFEGVLDKQIWEIEHKSNYVSRYCVQGGFYDEGQLQCGKTDSETHRKKLKKLKEYKPQPYTYRVDLTSGDETDVYYLGPKHILLDNGCEVLSFYDALGKQMVHYKTENLIKSGRKYFVKLRRQLEVNNAQLFGYQNMYTNEDMIYQNGVTDPFLVRILKMRRNQHKLVDIIATIQENQNRIVDTDMEKNIIIQGCAGSGKTMVLLHRLSSLQYRNPEFDFSHTIILTPNEQFNLHIKGVSESLQINDVERFSVDRYYGELLRRYQKSFQPKKQILPDYMGNQTLVNFIYSDEFKKRMKEAYQEIVGEMMAIVQEVQILCEQAKEPNIDLMNKTDNEIFTQTSEKIKRISDKAERQKSDLERNKAELQNNMDLKKISEEKLRADTETVKSTAVQIIEKVTVFFDQEVLYHETQLNVHQKNMAEIKDKSESISKARFVWARKSKQEKLQEELEKAEQETQTEKDILSEMNKFYNEAMQEQNEDDKIKKLKKLKKYSSQIQESIKQYEALKRKKSRDEQENTTLEQLISSQVTEREKLLRELFPESLSGSPVLKNSKQFSLLNIYNKVYKKSVQSFMKEYNIKSQTGIHKYDLFARLLFARTFFGKNTGEETYLCIDEAQDLSFNEYKLLKEINPPNMILNCFGDTNQCMTSGRGIKKWDDLEKYLNAERFELNENYRNTNQITKFCNDKFFMDVKQTGVDGLKVHEISRELLEEQLSKIDAEQERTAILISQSVAKDGYLKQELLDKEIANKISFDSIQDGFISFMYVHEVKGIEFDKVFVIHNAMTRNEKYIAYTRALTELVVVDDSTVLFKEPEKVQ